MKPNWIVTNHYRYDYYTLSSVFESYSEEMPKVLGFSFNYGYENLDILYDENNFAQQLEALIKQPKKVETQINYLITASNKILAAANKYGQKSDLKSFLAWHKALVKFLPSLGIVVAPERYLTTELRKFLSEDNFLAISFADDTKTIEEQISLLTIAKRKASGVLLDRAIAVHLKKYGWLGNKIMFYQPFTKQAIMQRIKAVKSTAATKLSELQNNRRNDKKALKRVLAKVSTEQKKLIILYRDLLFWRTARAEAVSLACTLTAPLFDAIAEKVHLTREELTRFSVSEIDKIITGKFKPDLANRTHYYAYLINGKASVSWGTDGKKTKRLHSITEFKGTIANKGIAKGVVKVVHEMKDISQVKKGAILVAAATSPAMVVAMEKAAAIVTDSGSMTAHAAIMSREFNIPCIVNTKIATQVLADGDVVKVNADEGKIVIIKKYDK